MAEPRPVPLERWLASPRAPWLAAGLALLLSSVALGNGFIGDDHYLRIVCRGNSPVPHPASAPFDLFDFVSGRPEDFRRGLELGNNPWWVVPNLHLAFLRPVASLSHAFDFALFPDSPAPMHLQSLLWFAASVLVVGALHRRFEPVAWASGLATLVFAIDDGHSIPLGWIANRNALQATFFAAVALLAHDKWRRDAWRAGLAVAPAALALGLLSGEIALGALGFLVAHAIVFEPGLRRRIVALGPALGVVVVWRVSYVLLGYGAHGSGLYLDPLGAPRAFARALLERTPILSFAALGGQGTDVWPMLSPRAAVGFAVVAALVSLAILLGLRRLLGSDRIARFWALGTGLALLPGATTFPNDRLLVIASIGSAALVARALARYRLDHGISRGLAWFFVFAHIVLPLPLLPVRTRSIARMGEVGEAVRTSLPADVAGRTLVVVNVPDSLLCFQLLAFVASLGEPLPARTRCLTATGNSIDVTRPSAQRLVLRSPDGFLESAMGTLGRSRDLPFRLGEKFEASAATVSIEELTAGGRPAAIDVDFDAPLESDELRFVSWRGQRFEPFVPPPVGGQATIEPAPIWRVMLGR